MSLRKRLNAPTFDLLHAIRAVASAPRHASEGCKADWPTLSPKALGYVRFGSEADVEGEVVEATLCELVS